MLTEKNTPKVCTPKICVVGSAMTDLTARTTTRPLAGETVRGVSFATTFGGKGSNQAIMASRLGAEVTMIAKLGNDAYGEAYYTNYQQENIDCSGITFVADEQISSGIAHIVVETITGENSIIIVPGANDFLSEEDVREAREHIIQADILLAQLETPTNTTQAAFNIAKENDTLTILNPAPAADLPQELIGSCDLLIPNETEAAHLTQMPVTSLEEASLAGQRLLARGVGAVIITLGENGALIVTSTTSKHLPAKAVQAFDTTGAGDAFVGSLGYFLALEKAKSGQDRKTFLQDIAAFTRSMEKALLLATATVKNMGAQASYPSREEARALLKNIAT